MQTDRYQHLPESKPDPVFSLAHKAAADKHQDTVNLVIGAYRDGKGKPHVLDVVRKAEKILLDPKFDKEYLPIDGHKEFCNLSVQLLLGKDSPIPLENVARVQAISGTGACRLAAEFFYRTLPQSTPVYVSNPTWANHRGIFESTGFTNVTTYRYWDAKSRGVAFSGMLADLRAAPHNAVVVLHLCAHNPTGADPSPEQWEQIAVHINILPEAATHTARLHLPRAAKHPKANFRWENYMGEGGDSYTHSSCQNS